MLGNATCEQPCSLTFSFSDIRIIGKGRRIQMKKIAHLLLGRFSIVAVSIILQFLWLVMVMYQFSYQFTYANLAIRTIAIIVVLVIVNRWTNPANKLSWTFIILLSPVLGLLLYMIFGRSSLTKKTQERMDSVNREVSACLYQTPEIKKQLEREDLSVYRQSRYINDWAGFPLYHNTSTKYYSCGEEMFPDMLAELEKAEHFIFLEYFIVDQGVMFDRIVEVLEQKSKEGVDVRLIYDDIGCINTLPPKYYKILQAKGIKCAAFNPFRPIMSVIMNNRDHRKIFVVDGKVGFTGGYNLANEYFNFTHPYGQWKDTGIRLEGEAVRSLTVTFLEMWNAVSDKDKNDSDFTGFLVQTDYQAKQTGFIQPYADSPMDHEQVGEEVYISMVNKAEKYCWFMTPYLIITDEMSHALCLAAKRGVDVRIITPGIPDKKMIYNITRSFYHGLVKHGVRIYEWTPGFCHAKMSVADDCMATCGTINLDYRSLYHHFENGCFMADCQAVLDIRNDLAATMDECREVTEQYSTGRSAYLRLGQLFMRLFAGLL